MEAATTVATPVTKEIPLKEYTKLTYALGRKKNKLLLKEHKGLNFRGAEGLAAMTREANRKIGTVVYVRRTSSGMLDAPYHHIVRIYA